MFLKSARIKNYKSFKDSNTIEFEEGINIIVGINNAGKTALLEALSLTFKSQPHKSLLKAPDGDSEVTLTFRIDGADVEKMLLEPDAALYIPDPERETGSNDKFIAQLKNHFDISRTFFEGLKFKSGLKWSHLRTITESSIQIYHYSKDGRYSFGNPTNYPTFAEPLIKEKTKNIFLFKAERVRLHQSSYYDNKVLQNDCNNLADVLRHFRENWTTSFDNYVETIKRILPNFHYITVPTRNNLSEIRIWTVPKETDRNDLSNSLENCGSGIGQVLAMIYVVLRHDPSIIIIDEPNSFLHPGATRELLRVFKENPQHQYFVSTHSPEIFTELKPASYNKLTYKEYETKVENHTYREFYKDYQELGFSPFYDVALWLEGETELEVFSLILDRPNIQFFQIFSANDIARKGGLIKKELDRICKVYSSLVQSRNGEPPPAKIKVVLDGEHLNPEKQDDYARRPDNIVYFLQRKMFENYILHPRSVAEVINENSETKISEVEVSTWIKDAQEVEKHVTKVEKDKKDYEWFKYVHGAKLLAELFTTKDLVYGKTDFSVEITKKIIKYDNSFLDPLREEIFQFISEDQAGSINPE